LSTFGASSPELTVKHFGKNNRYHSSTKTVMKRILFLLILFCSGFHFCFAQYKNLMENKLLLVVDIQEYYTKNKLPEATAQNLIDSVNTIISNTNPDNIIYIRSIHKVLNLSFSSPFLYVSYDTAAMRFDKRMNLVNDNIFTKEESNIFAVKALNDYIEQNNTKEIIIIGLMAEQCVYKSLLAGEELGYAMYAIPGAIAGKSTRSKDKVMKKLAEKGVEIIAMNTLDFE
jgi:nicotinamidase-related amidase